MLLEEQAADLIQRCEKILGIELSQTRGNLRTADNGAAAVWELLVIEAASYIGSIEYEPLPGASPDVRLRIRQGRPIWLEAAYLYPRFWDEERRSNTVVAWLFAEAKRRGIPASQLYPRLDGIPRGQAGPIRILPKLNERLRFLKQPELIEFFEGIFAHPNEPRTCTLATYTVSISYAPNAQGPHAISGGLVQEAPTSVTEHAVYRSLRAKARQHDVTGPRVVCIGSDQSPALSGLHGPGTGRPSVQEAVFAVFSEHSSLSAAMVVTIENVLTVLGPFYRRARGELFTNPFARELLPSEEVQALCSMNFNRWKYTYPLQKWESRDAKTPRRVTGSLTWRPGPMSLKVEIPTNIVVDALAGKTSISEALRLPQDHEITRALQEGWQVVSCRMIEGDVASGEASKLIFELVLPPMAAYWPKK